MTEEATVLIVEDQEGLARAYSAVLATEYTVETANDGQEALEKADDDLDVVLLDRRMPGMSGDEVLAELVDREFEAKIAMLTAVEPDIDILDMPFDDYVTKPIDNDELLGLVDRLLVWAEYDRNSQDFFRLASKKNALEAAGKDASEEYKRVVSRMKEIHTKVDETLEELSEVSELSDIDALQ